MWFGDLLQGYAVGVDEEGFLKIKSEWLFSLWLFLYVWETRGLVFAFKTICKPKQMV